MARAGVVDLQSDLSEFILKLHPHYYVFVIKLRPSATFPPPVQSKSENAAEDIQ